MLLIEIKRFSIRDILFTILVVALGVALFLTTKENLKLAAENKQLRNDAGLLHSEDQSKVNIIAIPDASLESQAWRISLPKNSEHIFQIVFSQSNIPCGTSSGKFPDPKISPSMAFTIPPNDLDELVFRIDLTDDPTKIKWAIDKLTGSEVEVEPDQAVWKKSMTNFTVNAQDETISCELGERITLFTAIRRRYDDVKKTWVNRTHADGVTISLRSFPDLTPEK